MTALYEVERKSPVADLPGLEMRLRSMGAAIGAPISEVDRYFNHPVADFGATDEALRIRTVGGASLITYKGPRVDRIVKTRREIEILLSPGQPPGPVAELLLHLGFREVATVRKQRREADVPWQGRSVRATLDEVEEVGNYCELELVVEQSEVEAAKALVASLAAELGLTKSESRSYLEMLLA
ncbi:MAG: class IV adenylate cyclase [Pirellulales bacterium]